MEPRRLSDGVRKFSISNTQLPQRIGMSASNASDHSTSHHGPQLSESDQITAWAISVWPHTDPRQDERSRAIQAVRIALLVREETAIELKKRQKPEAQQKAELKWALGHFHCKTFAKSDDERDQTTALGYLLVKYDFRKYKTPAKLRDALLAAGIATNPKTTVKPDVRSTIPIDLGETVSTSDLDRFVALNRSKDAERKRPG
jgi:hypothetical protein